MEVNNTLNLKCKGAVLLIKQQLRTLKCQSRPFKVDLNETNGINHERFLLYKIGI